MKELAGKFFDPLRSAGIRINVYNGVIKPKNTLLYLPSDVSRLTNPINVIGPDNFPLTFGYFGGESSSFVRPERVLLGKLPGGMSLDDTVTFYLGKGDPYVLCFSPGSLSALSEMVHFSFDDLKRESLFEYNKELEFLHSVSKL